MRVLLVVGPWTLDIVPANDGSFETTVTPPPAGALH